MSIKEELKKLVNTNNLEIFSRDNLIDNLKYNTKIDRTEKDIKCIISYLSYLMNVNYETKIDINTIKKIINEKIHDIRIDKIISGNTITYGINIDFNISFNYISIKIYNNIEQHFILTYIKDHISKILSIDLLEGKQESIFNKYDLLALDIEIEVVDSIKITIPFVFTQISEFYRILSEYDSNIESIIKNKKMEDGKC